MRLLLHRRPSAAMVVAIIALIVAASGTAVAATKLVNGDSLIKKGSLSGNRLRNHSVTGKQIKLSLLGTVPSASHASTADSAASASSATTASFATTASSANTAGAAPISTVTYVTATVSVAASGAGIPGAVACPAGTTVIGGGASIADKSGFGYVLDSYPNGKTGWNADFQELNVDTTGTVNAICAPAAVTAP